ncbi:hypothetical protein MY5147_001376 [Beauveria neobassiana]
MAPQRVFLSGMSPGCLLLYACGVVLITNTALSMKEQSPSLFSECFYGYMYSLEMEMEGSSLKGLILSKSNDNASIMLTLLAHERYGRRCLKSGTFTWSRCAVIERTRITMDDPFVMVAVTK